MKKVFGIWIQAKEPQSFIFKSGADFMWAWPNHFSDFGMEVFGSEILYEDVLTYIYLLQNEILNATSFRTEIAESLLQIMAWNC